MKTWTYEDKKVIAENNIVSYSDFAFSPVGQKPNAKALKACGWQLQKTQATYFVTGSGTSRNSNRFSN